jgi:hypothetical protein
MRSYEVARTLFSFLAFCAWSIVVVGGLVALIGAGGGSRYGGAGAGLLAMVPGLSIGIAGLLLVAFVQIGRATVDTAEYTQQMLKISRDQLEISKQGLNTQNSVPATYTGVVGATEAAAQTLQSFNSMANEAQEIEAASTDSINAALPNNVPAPSKDQNGFLLLNDQGSLLEFRGRKFGFADGKYDLAGQKFSNAQTLRKYLNGLKDLSA